MAVQILKAGSTLVSWGLQPQHVLLRPIVCRPLQSGRDRQLMAVGLVEFALGYPLCQSWQAGMARPEIGLGCLRMVLDRATLLHQLAGEICSIVADHPIRVGIDGLDAAGKTTLGDELGEIIHATGRQIIRASIDGFHHPQSTRYQRGRLSPEGYFLDSFDHERLRDYLLSPLGPGGSRRYRTASFDYLTDTPVSSQGELAAEDAVLLFDGVFLLRSEILPYWDYSIYLYVAPEEALKRALRRDAGDFGGPEKVRERYQARYFPAHELYLAAHRPTDIAHRVIDNEDPDEPHLQSCP